MFLTQSALNAGQLIAAQPGLTLSDPLISVLWGLLAFHEQVRQGWYILGEMACAGVIVAGVLMLARSPFPAAGGRRFLHRRRAGGRLAARGPGAKRIRHLASI